MMQRSENRRGYYPKLDLGPGQRQDVDHRPARLRGREPCRLKAFNIRQVVSRAFLQADAEFRGPHQLGLRVG